MDLQRTAEKAKPMAKTKLLSPHKAPEALLTVEEGEEKESGHSSGFRLVTPFRITDFVVCISSQRKVITGYTSSCMITSNNPVSAELEALYDHPVPEPRALGLLLQEREEQGTVPYARR